MVAGAAAALDPAVGERGGEGVLGSPAGAVSGYQEVGCQFGERLDGGADARGEVGAAQAITKATPAISVPITDPLTEDKLQALYSLR